MAPACNNSRLMDATHHFERGETLAGQGQFREAAAAYRDAVQARPEFPSAYFRLGVALRAAGDLSAASEAFAEAAAQDPAHPDARYELANIYRDLRRLSDAAREMQAVIAAQPDNAKALSALGVIYMDAGRAADALLLFEQAMQKDPRRVNAATNWLNAQQYVPGVTAQGLAESHARWTALHADTTPERTFRNAPTTDRPLRVGFVSPDFGQHPIGFLTVGLFENLDVTQIRPMIFSTRPQVYEDALSARIARATSWTNVFGLSDAALAAFITSSRVDILIDLSGHTANHRLLVFAQRAAPVQATWLGYGSTTGLKTMDYVLANDTLIPPEMEPFYTERVLRFPHWHACFEPPIDAPAVGPPPAVKNGFVTFGCFNHPVKFNDAVFASYARILARTPGSRLKFSYKTLSDPEAQERIRTAFATHGIDAGRIDISGEVPAHAFLAAYNETDVALDAFPYSGCMTTCEALWMGCPVVTFPGATYSGRQSASILAAAGLERLIAEDKDSFETLAVDLAGDIEALSTLRREMRARVSASSVCDAPGFAREFTAALQKVWMDWCHEVTS